MKLSVEELLPSDHSGALLLGRVYDPSAQGPSVALIREGALIDLSDSTLTMSALLSDPKLLADVVDGTAERASRKTWDLSAVLEATLQNREGEVRLLSPIDTQAIKAAGVTFVGSMIERVIDEKTAGDPSAAAQMRKDISQVIGGNLRSVEPGSANAAALKTVLVQRGLWSQYLEVGIGPDAEIFSKAQVLSSVGTATEVGVLARSAWNNPEPEVVLIVNDSGEVVGATLGNDVNLRDFEGRSALLLSKAKDNNRSCAIGPFIRLFNDSFTMNSVKELTVNLTIEGDDGFRLNDHSSMSEISRDPEELVRQTFGDSHQYPDGFALFTGTLFSPTQDRREAGRGFTHNVGDVVSVSAPELGTLRNRVNTSENAEPWNFGINALIANLLDRSRANASPLA